MIATMELYKKKKQPVSSAQCDAFVDKCCELGAPDMALGLFARKRHSPIRPEAISSDSLTRLTRELSAADMLDECFKLNDIARKLGFSRSKMHFSSLVEACVSKSDTEGVARVLSWTSPIRNRWWDDALIDSVLSHADWNDTQKAELLPTVEAFLESQSNMSQEFRDVLDTWKPVDDAGEEATDDVDEEPTEATAQGSADEEAK